MDRVVVAGGTESLSTAPQSSKRAEPGGEPQPWMSPSHPETPDAPAVRHVDHRRREHRPRDGPHPPRRRRVGALQPPAARSRRSTTGAFEDEIVPVAVHRPDGDAAHVLASTSTRAAGRRSRRSPRSRCSTPRSTAPPSPPGTRPGSTTAPPRSWSSRRRLRRRARAHAARPRPCRGRRSAIEPARTGLGPDARHPEGARPRRADDRRHRPVRDQRGVLLGAGRGGRARSASTARIVNVNGSGCSLGHPIAAPAPAWSSRWSTSCAAGARPSAACRCARAAAWAPPSSSKRCNARPTHNLASTSPRYTRSIDAGSLWG